MDQGFTRFLWPSLIAVFAAVAALPLCNEPSCELCGHGRTTHGQKLVER